ncbi:MAG TPA: hypothetical protein VJS88_08825, partial [Chthoniobacterales bacterium]|nr:hypothetical protein [Chthoniobacterales bacterium]
MQSPTNQRVTKHLKRLIWVYFFLLIFEGVFRKWILPQYSDVLLVIRDPVVLVIYALAIKARVFPRNSYILALGIIAVLSWLVSLVVLEPYLSLKPLILVTGFGFRSNFLHLPLIFVVGRVLDSEDVKKLGYWILIGLLPMCVLLAVQFNSAPDAFINRTAGLGESQQITAGGGKIRPPGTFSFVSGVIFYAALSAAYLLYGALTRGVYRNWLLFSGGLALAVTIGVSGSRSVLLAVLVVVASLLVIILVRPTAVNQFGRNLLIVVVVGLIVVRLPVFKEGVQVLSDRFTAVAEAEETTIARGLMARMFSGFTEGFLLIPRAPIGGYGLGIGTNGGAKFLTGRAIFLLTEGEWGRVVLESGPILGLAYLLWRTVVTFNLGLFSYRQLKRGEILPIMFFGAGFLALLNGQFGQPTNLGFAVFICGLCLAAGNTRAPSDQEQKPRQGPIHRGIARRSRYADQLHGAVAPP